MERISDKQRKTRFFCLLWVGVHDEKGTASSMIWRGKEWPRALAVDLWVSSQGLQPLVCLRCMRATENVSSGFFLQNILHSQPHLIVVRAWRLTLLSFAVLFFFPALLQVTEKEPCLRLPVSLFTLKWFLLANAVTIWTMAKTVKNLMAGLKSFRNCWVASSSSCIAASRSSIETGTTGTMCCVLIVACCCCWGAGSWCCSGLWRVTSASEEPYRGMLFGGSQLFKWTPVDCPHPPGCNDCHLIAAFLIVIYSPPGRWLAFEADPHRDKWFNVTIATRLTWLQWEN